MGNAWRSQAIPKEKLCSAAALWQQLSGCCLRNYFPSKCTRSTAILPFKAGDIYCRSKNPPIPLRTPLQVNKPRQHHGARAALTHSPVLPPSGRQRPRAEGATGSQPAGPAPAPRPPGHRRDPAATFALPRRRASRRPHPPRRTAAPAQCGPVQPRPRPLRPAPARYLGGRTGSDRAASQRPPDTLRFPRPRRAHPAGLGPAAPARPAARRVPPRPGGRTTTPRAPWGAVAAAAASPPAPRAAGAGLGVPWAALGREARPARESRAGHGRGGAAAAGGGARGVARRRAPEGPWRERGVGAAGAARRKHAGAAGGGGDADRRRRLLAGEDPGGDVGRVGPGGGAGHQVLGERPVPQDVAGPAEGGLRVPEAQRLTLALPAEPPARVGRRRGSFRPPLLGSSRGVLFSPRVLSQILGGSRMDVLCKSSE